MSWYRLALVFAQGMGTVAVVILAEHGYHNTAGATNLILLCVASVASYVAGLKDALST